MFGFLTLLSALGASIIPVSAHSWIEEYQVIGLNGSYIGDRGFSRGYIGREDPTFEGSVNSLWLLPQSDAVMPDGTVRLRINSSDPVCRASQSFHNYSNPAFPPLKVAPGDYVAMKYLENGHVTLPWNQPGKPPHGGTVYVFGTSSPIKDQMLADVMKWTNDGKGGNGKGRLLTTQNFDDGRCHQVNMCFQSVERQGAYPNETPGQPGSFNELWCETNVQIPEDITGKLFTTYWVWQWPTEPCKECPYPEGKDEYYTTCADHEVVARAANDYVKLADEPATNTLPGEDFTMMAVSTYKERMAYTTHPVVLENWANFNNKVAKTTDAKVAAFVSSCAIPTPASTGLPPLCPTGKWGNGTMSAHYLSVGRASAQSAWSAWKAGAYNTLTTPTSAPAASPTGHRKGGHHKQGGSPSVTVTRVKSVITTYYTSTITLSPSPSSESDSSVSSSSPPRGPPQQESAQPAPSQQESGQPGGGYATVTTEAQASKSGNPVDASALIPGHDLSTKAGAAPTYGRGDQDLGSALAPAALSPSSGLLSSAVPTIRSTRIDFDWTTYIPINTPSVSAVIAPAAQSSPGFKSQSFPASSSTVEDIKSHSHSSGCRHKQKTGTSEIKHVRTTSASPSPSRHPNGTYQAGRVHPRQFGE